MNNSIVWMMVIVGYALMMFYLVRDYKRAFKMYNITFNGSRYVVRDEQGRFVTITKSRWDIAALGGGF